MKNHRKFWAVFLVVFLFIPGSLFSQSGDQLFTVNCRACHTIGGGKLIGPDLKDVTTKRTEQWLLSFIKSSQTFINSGDADAVAIFNEFKIPMPDQNLTEAQIKDVLAYITTQSGAATTTQTVDNGESIKHSSGKTLEDVNADDLDLGRQYFDGTERFTNGGPSCITCHNVNNEALIGGGLLAMDLSKTITRLGPTGVHTMITNPAFPAMRTSFQDNPITPDEAFYLVAFLKKADYDSDYYVAADYNSRMMNAGLIGTAALFVAFGGIWWNRKKKSVNHDIYKRQIKSK